MTVQDVEFGSVVSRPLFIDTVQLQGGVRIVVAGELDLASAAEFGAALAEDDLHEIDLSEVTFMDSSALRVLIEAQQTADRPTPVIVAASAQVRRLLKVTGLGPTLAPALHVR